MNWIKNYFTLKPRISELAFTIREETTAGGKIIYTPMVKYPDYKGWQQIVKILAGQSSPMPVVAPYHDIFKYELLEVKGLTLSLVECTQIIEGYKAQIQAEDANLITSTIYQKYP